jgi:hypothetical protein
LAGSPHYLEMEDGAGDRCRRTYAPYVAREGGGYSLRHAPVVVLVTPARLTDIPPTGYEWAHDPKRDVDHATVEEVAVILDDAALRCGYISGLAEARPHPVTGEAPLTYRMWFTPLNAERHYTSTYLDTWGREGAIDRLVEVTVQEWMNRKESEKQWAR